MGSADIIQFINNHLIESLVFIAALPFCANLYKGAARKINNYRKGYPTFITGAMYSPCFTPSGGSVPMLLCVENHFFGVKMQFVGVGETGGGIFEIENRFLDDWVLPLAFDPLNPAQYQPNIKERSTP